MYKRQDIALLGRDLKGAVECLNGRHQRLVDRAQVGLGAAVDLVEYLVGAQAPVRGGRGAIGAHHMVRQGVGVSMPQTQFPHQQIADLPVLVQPAGRDDGRQLRKALAAALLDVGQLAGDGLVDAVHGSGCSCR